MTDALEEAIRDWVDSFEVFPVGESKPIRLLADSVELHRAKDFGIEWLWYITCISSTHPDQARGHGPGWRPWLIHVAGLLAGSPAVVAIPSSKDAPG